MSFRKIALSVALIVCVVAMTKWITRHGHVDEEPGAPVVEAGSGEMLDLEAAVKSLTKGLVKAGWTQATAERVVRLNRSRYEILLDAAPGELDREIAKLATLQVEDHVERILERDPSVAGLLCLANLPQKTAKCLLDAKENGYYEQIKGSFVIRVDGWNIDAWSEILTRHGELAGRLIQGGIVQPELLLNYPTRDSEVANAYGDWLEMIFEAWPWPNSASDGEFDRRFSYVAKFGEDIREKMRAEPEFRRAFSATIWPTLLRLADEDPGILFAGPEWGVWDLFLERPDAETLLERSGILAADLLAGEDALPERVHDQIASYLLAANWEMLDQIDRYRVEPLVISLIERKSLGPRYLPDLFAQLDRAGDSYPAKLRYFTELSEQALIETLDPIDPGVVSWVPGYSTYALIRKASQGRDLSAMDWVGTGLDAVEVVFLFTPIKGASGALQKMVREAGENQVKRTALVVTKELGERAAKEMTEAATERQLTSRIGNGILDWATKEVREELLSKGMIDITPFVQKSFQLGNKLHINRESFKNLTGLEARLFMRSDGKVYVSLPELIAGRTHTATFLNRSAGAIGGNAIGGEVVERAAPTVVEAYNQHIAAWWLAQAAETIQPY